jgi:broad specificity phosphatase PhoE
MRQIILVRHGESQTNAGVISHGSIGDHKVCLTEKGIEQAKQAGKNLPPDFLVYNGLVYRSPYQRARQTCDYLLEAAGYTTRRGTGYRVLEDPRLREVDHGYAPVAAQEAMRREHGWFYYRFERGESPADCYDRCCTFLESMARQVKRKMHNSGHGQMVEPNVLIVTHGMAIRCFVMRYMHLSVEQFESLANPQNGGMIRIMPLTVMERDGIEPQIKSGRWGITGLEFRDDR